MLSVCAIKCEAPYAIRSTTTAGRVLLHISLADVFAFLGMQEFEKFDAA